ncbi:MAG: radical SAM protein [Chitinispirillaceae bacterium]|nr:radical SAM protein [Chitinispirillaceae bacterium]
MKIKFIDAETFICQIIDETALKAISFLENEKYTRETIKDKIFINGVLPSFPGESWNRFFTNCYGISNFKRIPLWTDIVCTGRCHCNCWHCFRSKHKNNEDLELDIIASVMQDAKECGAVIIGVTGGEPMLRNDIVEIINCIPNGTEGQLYTTGININDQFYKKIENSNLTRCVISLDHYNETIVNQRRNYKNAYSDAIRAISILADTPLYVTVTLCLTEELCSETELNKYLEFVCKLRADEIRIILPVPQGNLENKDNKRLYIDAINLLRIFKKNTLFDTELPSILLFCDYESRYCLGCGAGTHILSINNDGNVSPCVALPLSFGNVKETKLKEIYTNMEPFFKTSWPVCYGKQMNGFLVRNGLFKESYPYSVDFSRYIASQCSNGTKQGAFFKALTSTEQVKPVLAYAN